MFYADGPACGERHVLRSNHPHSSASAHSTPEQASWVGVPYPLTRPLTGEMKGHTLLAFDSFLRPLPEQNVVWFKGVPSSPLIAVRVSIIGASSCSFTREQVRAIHMQPAGSTKPTADKSRVHVDRVLSSYQVARLGLQSDGSFSSQHPKHPHASTRSSRSRARPHGVVLLEWGHHP